MTGNSSRVAAMPKITYIEYGGREHRVAVAPGLSVMRGVVNNNIPGIDADCGSECACATCHIYVDEGWLGADRPPGPGLAGSDHAELCRARPATNSRLSCQITVTEALDGLIVRMPEDQH